MEIIRHRGSVALVYGSRSRQIDKTFWRHSYCGAAEYWVRDHSAPDVLDGAAHLFAGVEDVEGIEDALHFCKKLYHPWREHQGEVGGAHDAVIVLARDGAFVLRYESVDLLL